MLNYAVYMASTAKGLKYLFVWCLPQIINVYMLPTLRGLKYHDLYYPFPKRAELYLLHYFKSVAENILTIYVKWLVVNKWSQIVKSKMKL